MKRKETFGFPLWPSVLASVIYICKKRDKKEKKKEIEQFVGYILKSRYLPYMYIMHNL